MKLVVTRYVNESPALAVIPESEYEAAVLSRYWRGAELSRVRASSVDESADGFCYSIKFREPQKPPATVTSGRPRYHSCHSCGGPSRGYYYCLQCKQDREVAAD
jgi:hypothetical protein